jgi:zinc and cadmium transporter
VAAHATGRGTLWGLAGLSTFLAVLLHKPLDAFSITTLMAAGGWPKRPQFLVNAFFALMCPAGAAAFYLGFAGQSAVLGAALAFSAGVFLCISLGDLLPEVQFHAHDPVKLSIALLAGVSLAYGVHWLE